MDTKEKILNKVLRSKGNQKVFVVLLVLILLLLLLPPITTNAAASKKMSLYVKTTKYTRTTHTSKSTKKQTITIKNLPSNYKVVWKSNDTKIAAVKVKANTKTSKAILTTKLGKKGTTTITATVKDKKTGKTVKTYKQKITVNQGAVGVRIVDSSGKEIKSTSVALYETLKLYSKVLPADSNISSHKKTSWTLSANDKKLVSIKNNILTPNQGNLIGRGSKNITVNLKGYKAGKAFNRKLKVTIDGGKLVADPTVNSQQLTMNIGLTVSGDLSKLKGSTITLTGISGNALGKKITAAYSEAYYDIAVFKLDNKDKKLTSETKAYNGTYKVTSSLSGTQFLNNTVTYTELIKNTDDVKILKAIIQEQNKKGATVSSDLNSWEYYWDTKTGRLIGIDWSFCNLNGNLDVSGLTALTQLYCEYNKITDLNVSGLTALTELACGENRITNLDVSNCTALTYLDCYDNRLTGLDVSNCTALIYLICSYNRITNLDVSSRTTLVYLDCSDNELTGLNVNGCSALIYLDCSYNDFTELDIGNCAALMYLDCSSNNITSLDISKCKALTYFYCYDNRIKSLDLSNCKNLTDFYCDDNVKIIK